MILARVWYELFEWEVEEVDTHPDAEAVELRRQLRLEATDGTNVYLAWTGGGGQGDEFHVGHQPSGFCRDDPEFVREATARPLWVPLVGRPIELEYRDDWRQVLAVRAGPAVVLCCSFGHGLWGMDILRVCRRLTADMTSRHPWQPSAVPEDLRA